MENSPMPTIIPSDISAIPSSPSATLTSTEITPTASPSATPTPASPLGISLNPCPKNTQFTVLCDLKASQMGQYISIILTFAIITAIIISLFSLIWGGIRWIIAGGDKTKTQAARNTILGAIIGLIIVLLSYFILNIILGIFGLSLNQLNIPYFQPFH